jgi:hypothetical protein
MKNQLSRYLTTNIVLIVLLFAVGVIVLYRKYANPSEPDMSKPVVYYLSDELHFVVIPDAIEQEQKNGRVPVNKAALRVAFPVPQSLGPGGFTGMSFIVPGVTGLSDPSTYFTTPPLNRRDDNIVGVWNIAPWSKEDYVHNPLGARDRRSAWIRTDDYWLKHPAKDMFGMQCYDQGESKSCLGEILPGEWASVEIDNLLDSTTSPIAMRPLMQVSYFTKAYGGLTIQWRTHAKHAAKWREIDAKFWRLMHERNVLEQP